MRALTRAAFALGVLTIGFLGCGSGGSGSLPTAPAGGSGGGRSATPTSDSDSVNAVGTESGTIVDSPAAAPAKNDEPAEGAKPGDTKPEAKPATGEDKKSDDEKPKQETKPN